MDYNSKLKQKRPFVRTPYEHQDTIILVPEKNADGDIAVVPRSVDFSTLLPADDYQLDKLLKAGINPQSMHCNTSLTGDRISKETEAQSFLAALDANIPDTPAEVLETENN